MLPLRILLTAMLVLVAIYTGVVMVNEGLTLYTVFLNDLLAMNWAGQFNLDFFCYLVLSGLWVAWRHAFSAAGIAMGIVASLAGILFLSVYLIVCITRENGDMKGVLMGVQR